MLLRLMLRRSLCEVFLGLGVGLLSLLYIAIIAYNILCFAILVNGVFEGVLPKMVVLQKIKLQKI
jgi:hypothetical protein